MLGTLSSYRSAGRHLNHRDVHLTDVGVQTTQLLECAAAVHAREQRYTFSLSENRKHIQHIIYDCFVYILILKLLSRY